MFGCFKKYVVLTFSGDKTCTHCYFRLFRLQTEAWRRWQNGRTDFGYTLNVPLDRLFIFVILLMMKIYYCVWTADFKWAHVLSLNWEKQKLQTLIFFFFLNRPHSSGMFLFLIRCTIFKDRLGSTTQRLKFSRHPIPHETLCKCFSAMLTGGVTCPRRKRYNANIVMSSGMY